MLRQGPDGRFKIGTAMDSRMARELRARQTGSGLGAAAVTRRNELQVREELKRSRQS